MITVDSAGTGRHLGLMVPILPVLAQNIESILLSLLTTTWFGEHELGFL